MTAQEWYGFSCLILGALLMAGQVFVLLQTQQNVASATKAVHDAKEAAEQQAAARPCSEERRIQASARSTRWADA